MSNPLGGDFFGRLANRFYGGYHGRDSHDCGRFRCGDWVGVPDRDREIHHQQGSRFRALIVRASAIAAVAAVAGALALAPASPAAAATVYNPPGLGDLARFDQLPDCSDIYTSNSSNDAIDPAVLLAGVGLGWRATKTGAFVNGDWASAVTPIIPCWFMNGTRPTIRVDLYLSALVSSPEGSGPDIGISSVTITCFDSSLNPQPDIVLNSNSFPGGTAPDFPGQFQRVQPALSSDNGSCYYFSSVHVLVQTYTSPRQSRVSAVWHPSFWTTNDGHYSIPSGLGDIPDPWGGLELPVNCVFTPSGSDIFELIGSAFDSFVSTAVCMVTPVGWDRAGVIASTWQDSAPGKVGAALDTMFPSGLVCGEVATLPMWGTPLVLNTCGADLAPGWVKVGVGWVIVMGLGLLVVRRIFWAVGSRA